MQSAFQFPYYIDPQNNPCKSLVLNPFFILLQFKTSSLPFKTTFYPHPDSFFFQIVHSPFCPNCIPEIANKKTHPKNNRKITIEELKTVVTNTNKKTPGIAGINKKHLTEAPIKKISQILDLLNSYSNLGYFPDAFNISKIILIPKPNKSTKNAKNYRPIPLLEYIGKTNQK